MNMNIYEIGIGKSTFEGSITKSGYPYIAIDRHEHDLKTGDQLPASKTSDDGTILRFHSREGLLLLKRIVDQLVEKNDPWPPHEVLQEKEQYVWQLVTEIQSQP